MIDGKSVIAIIPARAGSKGLPGKNIRPLCGKPLIVWSIEQALASAHVDVVVVSTDGAEIAAIAQDAGAEVPFLRPADLASDTASTYDVIRHALGHYAPRQFDYTLLLEPTSPLRAAGDIDRAIAVMHQQSASFDSLVALGLTDHCHPSYLKKLDGMAMTPFLPDAPRRDRRQELDPAYFPSGVLFIGKTTAVLDENTFYTRRCIGHVLPHHQNFEVDDIVDFLCVEAIMSARLKGTI